MKTVVKRTMEMQTKLAMMLNKMQTKDHQGRSRFSISCAELPKPCMSLPLRMAWGCWSQSSAEWRVAELKGSGGMEGLADTTVILAEQCWCC